MTPEEELLAAAESLREEGLRSFEVALPLAELLEHMASRPGRSFADLGAALGVARVINGGAQ